MAITIVTDLPYKDTTEQQRINILSAVTKLCHGLRAFESDGFLCIGIENNEFEMGYLDPSKLLPVISPILAGVQVNVKEIKRFAFFGREESNPAFSFSSMLHKALREKPGSQSYLSILANANECLQSLDARYKAYSTESMGIARSQFEETTQQMKQSKKAEKSSRHGFDEGFGFSGFPRGHSPDLDDDMGFLEVHRGVQAFSLGNDLAISLQNEQLTFDSHNKDRAKQLNDRLIIEKEMVLLRVYSALAVYDPDTKKGVDVFAANPFETRCGVQTYGIEGDPKVPSAVKFAFKRVQHLSERFLDPQIQNKYLDIDQAQLFEKIRSAFPGVRISARIDNANQQLMFALEPLFIPPPLISGMFSKITIALYKSGLALGYVPEGDIDVFYCAADQKRLAEPEVEEAETLTSEQDEYLSAIASMYIEDILDKCNNYGRAVSFFRAAFVDSSEENRAKIQEALKLWGVDRSILQSVISLSEIIYGKAKLQTELFSGSKQPSRVCLGLAIQRYCFEELRKRYAAMSDEDKVILYIGLMMMSEEAQKPFLDFPRVIRDALKNIPAAKEFFGRGIGQMIIDAIREMGILGDLENPNIDRVNALGLRFESQFIADYVIELIRKKTMPGALTFEEEKFDAVSGRVFDAHRAEISSPKVWSKSGRDRFVMFKPENKAVALALGNTLNQQGFHVAVLDIPEKGKIGVTVQLRKF